MMAGWPLRDGPAARSCGFRPRRRSSRIWTGAGSEVPAGQHEVGLPVAAVLARRRADGFAGHRGSRTTICPDTTANGSCSAAGALSRSENTASRTFGWAIAQRPPHMRSDDQDSSYNSGSALRPFVGRCPYETAGRRMCHAVFPPTAKLAIRS